MARNYPHIYEIVPNEVALNWEGLVTVNGTGFADAFLLFDQGRSIIVSMTDTKIVARVTADITGSAGKQSVKVHNTIGGDLSNAVDFYVRP